MRAARRRAAPLPLIPAHSASLRAFTPVFDGRWTRVNALMLGIQRQGRVPATDPRDASVAGCPSRGRTDVAHPAATRAPRTEADLIFLAWIWSSAGVLLRRARYARAPVPPRSRSWPFPARLGGAVPISSRRPTANTRARTRGILREMPPWRAPRGEQAGARPVSQPPAPA